jgi:hypothetical protein
LLAELLIDSQGPPERGVQLEGCLAYDISHSLRIWIALIPRPNTRGSEVPPLDRRETG